MLKLKIVLQGGGANLVTLMAAASVLEELQDEKVVKVTKVVGVSAGAITACMLSSSTRIDEYRGRVVASGSDLLKHFALKIDPMSRFSIANKMIWGRPIFKEKHLKTFLENIFVKQTNGAKMFDNLDITTVIVASDIRYLEKVQYGQGLGGQGRLVEAIADSCAIPYAFRTFKDPTMIVDGGVCSNLPVDEVLFDEDDDSLVLAFGFVPQSQSDPKNAIQYGLSLLSTSIDSTVSENMERVKLKGGEVVFLPRSYSLFEFEKALNEGLDHVKFEHIKDQIRPKILSSLDKLRQRSRIRESDAKLRSKILTAYSDIDKQVPKSRESVVIINANSFFPKGTKNHGPDSFQHIVYVSSKQGSLQLASTGLSTNSDEVYRGQTDWEVQDHDGNELEATQILAPEVREGPSGPVTMHKAMFFLKEPFDTSKGRLRIKYSEDGDYFDDLKNYEVDFIRHHSTPPHTFDKVVQILIYPKSFENITFDDLKPNFERLSSSEAKLPSKSDLMLENWKSGKLMSQNAIKEYLGDTLPVSCSAIGWITEDVESGHYCGVLVTKN